MSARADANNQSGNQMMARDAEWSVSLLDLPGRAGLDLGLALSYSSAAAWTRSGPYSYFDEDNSSLSAGFRLGFPAVQELFFDAQVGQSSYLLITGAGSRVELRQVGSSNLYEAADSSYLQLTDNSNSLLLRGTDGTQMSYTKIENEWRCTNIKDRNGNYLTANYNSLGDLTSVVDTLGRVVTFNYDGNANLASITQTWNGQGHTWATFHFDSVTIQPNFSGVSVSGVANSQSVSMLTMVGLGDGSYYKFAYTNWNSGEVVRVTHYASDSNPASDSHERVHTAFDYLASDDSTRLTATRVAAQNWTGINGLPAEVTTSYGFDGGSACWLVTPDGTVYKEFYGTGWQKRLPQQTQIWSADGTEQKWTTATWTHDGATNASYPTNPRATESNIYDAAGNRRRTTIDYQASFGLPSLVTEYAADASTPLRFTVHGYKNDDAYVSRRIIGLPYVDYVFDGNWQLASKISYEYDWRDGYMNTQAPSLQHDTANYGSNLDVGRGILVAVRRWNVNAQDDASQAIWVVQRGYNLAGDIIFTRDAAGHQTNINYGDSFSDGNNSRNTLGYPTAVTDPDGFSSSVQYNYDFGAKTRMLGPPPTGQAQGVVQSFYYDSAGRVQQMTTENNWAYTRFYYGPNYLQSWSSVNNVADEAYAIETYDGLGRMIGTASNHPGSIGGYRAQNTIYDKMGRTMKQSNPTEINVSWVPWGDDGAGWLYTQQTYDWKGRPFITTNPDTTTKTVSYGGCGCAGGEVVTLTDEGTVLTNGVTKQRQQKIYHDVLGRVWKTEALNWDGTGTNGVGGTVSATTNNKYNALDQVIRVRQYVGPAPLPEPDGEGSGYQTTTLNYDGHGRLWKNHVPQQQVDPNNLTSTDHTTYVYNPDDSVSSITDARGVTTTLGYNGRHLLTSITYPGAQNLPAGVAARANVSYSYDAAGNRTTMDDGMGHVDYSYDQLSRLLWENRHFNSVNNPNSADHNYKLSYGYNLAGNMTNITNPSGTEIAYNFDAVGRLTGVTGSSFANVTTYASNIQYRAWGAAKNGSYGNNSSATLTYNSRMQPVQYELTGPPLPANYNVPLSLREHYQYYADGRLQQMIDLDDTTDQAQGQYSRHFSRTFSYDNLARVTSFLQMLCTRDQSGGDSLSLIL